MMEGERILKIIKEDKRLEGIVSDLKVPYFVILI